jgi:tetratricopeptide (TPR) repeat protein
MPLMNTLLTGVRLIFTNANWQRRSLITLCLLLLAPLPWPLALGEDFRTAQAAAARKDYAAAATALADAAERLPYMGSVVYQAGLAELAAGKYEPAIQYIQSAAALDGWTPDKRVALGDAYSGHGDQNAAADQWSQALKDRPTDAALLQRLAGTYETTGRYTDTVAILTSLVALGQATPDMQYRLALLTAADSPSDALARLAVVIQVAPNRAANARALQQAIQTGLQAKDEAYTFGLTGFTFIQIQEWALAEKALRHAVAINPNYARAHAYLGLALDSQNKDGRSAYETALKLEPNSPWINYMLGVHWRHLGESGTAINYFNRAVALDPQNPAFAAELANTYAADADLTEAEHWFREAVRLAPQDAHLWLVLARFYCDQNYHIADEGLPAARQAVGLAPNDAAAVDSLGCALLLTDDLVNAEKNILRALSLDANLPSAYDHLGQLYLRQNKTPEAEAAFNHALALDPDGPYGHQAFQALIALAAPATPKAEPATPPAIPPTQRPTATP